MGKKEKLSFKSFFGSKINEWYKTRDEKKTIELVINDIDSKGNASKHDLHEFSDAKQLKNDFDTLEKFIITCIESIKDDS